jgi:hypothetical protein
MSVETAQVCLVALLVAIVVCLIVNAVWPIVFLLIFWYANLPWGRGGDH